MPIAVPGLFNGLRCREIPIHWRTNFKAIGHNIRASAFCKQRFSPPGL
jgi:hypothetical protein